MAQTTLKVKVNDPIFHTCQEFPKMHAWCKSFFPVEIIDELSEVGFSADMTWNLFNNSKNRFCHRKTGFKFEKKKRFYDDKTVFSTDNLKTSRIQFQKWSISFKLINLF